MSNAKVSAGKAVGIHFTLKLCDGKVVDSSEGQEPMLYLHGEGNIVPGLERELDGKSVGDKIEANVDPEDGYGARNEAGVTEVPRTDFPDDVKFVEGMQFVFEGEGGEVAPGWVIKFDAENVTVDLNHPLAGEHLHFEVEICSVRDATEEERKHGHPHGPGGHEH
jgi:FKBP-type peptidyl-prolyl cis-trans isomerase SlyD